MKDFYDFSSKGYLTTFAAKAVLFDAVLNWRCYYKKLFTDG